MLATPSSPARDDNVAGTPTVVPSGGPVPLEEGLPEPPQVEYGGAVREEDLVDYERGSDS